MSPLMAQTAQREALHTKVMRRHAIPFWFAALGPDVLPCIAVALEAIGTAAALGAVAFWLIGHGG